MVVAGRAGKPEEALKLLDRLSAANLRPDTAAFNAALVACRTQRPPNADAALRLWRQIVDESTRAQPDGITVAEAVACLERSNRTADADAAFADALALKVPLKQSRSALPLGAGSAAFLDEDGEYDVSGMTVPLVRCAVRRAVRAADGGAPVTFITGVGARRQYDPDHVPLRAHVLAQLRDELGLVAFVPDDAPGTVKVDPKSLAALADGPTSEPPERKPKPYRSRKKGGRKRR